MAFTTVCFGVVCVDNPNQQIKNCIERSRAIGIKNPSEQGYFIDRTFGVQGRAFLTRRTRGLKQRLNATKPEMDEKERNILDSTRQTKYGAFLEEKYSMIKKSMIGTARRKAGLPKDENGNPVHCYTNSSESMNHALKAEKNYFMRNNPGLSKLSKLQFTRHVFESIHERQQEELKLALPSLIP